MKKKRSELGHGLVKCPLCHGTGQAKAEEAGRYLAENAGEPIGAPYPPPHHEPELVEAGVGKHTRQVRSYPDTEVLWRRSPKE